MIDADGDGYLSFEEFNAYQVTTDSPAVPKKTVVPPQFKWYLQTNDPQNSPPEKGMSFWLFSNGFLSSPYGPEHLDRDLELVNMVSKLWDAVDDDEDNFTTALELTKLK